MMFRGHVTESTGLEDPGPNPFWRRRIPGEHSKFVQARPTVTIWVFGGDLFRTSCLGKRSPISVSEFCVSQSVQSGEGRRIVSSWRNETSWDLVVRAADEPRAWGNARPPFSEGFGFRSPDRAVASCRDSWGPPRRSPEELPGPFLGAPFAWGNARRPFLESLGFRRPERAAGLVGGTTLVAAKGPNRLFLVRFCLGRLPEAGNVRVLEI